MTKITIADGSIISYNLLGNTDKTTIILTNGSIFNYNQFSPVLFPELYKILGDNYSYLRYDYVGIGNSSEVDQFDYCKIADQHVQLMDALNIKKAHHFGYSKGGAIIQLVAIKHPNRVLSNTLLAGPNLAFWNDTIIAEFKERVNQMEEIKHLIDERINEDNYKFIYEVLYQRMLFGDKLGFMHRIKNWYLRKTIKPMLIGTPVSSLKKLYSYYSKELLDDEQQKQYISDINNLDIPFLILHGTEDALVDIQGSIELDKNLKNSKLVKFDGIEHTTPAIIKKHGRLIMTEFADFISKL